MDNERNQRRFESVYSNKVRAGKRRTYFFDVRQTKGDDYYLTLTESTRKFNSDGYERHKIFLYKEDFNRFMAGLEDALNYVKTELMPDYDYDEYTRRHEEWEAKRLEEEANGTGYHSNNNEGNDSSEVETEDSIEEVSEEPEATEAEPKSEAKPEPESTEPEEPKSIESEDDMAW